MHYLVIGLLLPFFLIYYCLEINTVVHFGNEEFAKIFLSISTFLFAIFTGFFISRQASRYNYIRKLISQFDGNMSSIYRNADYFGEGLQNKIKSIIKKHYNKLLKQDAWDYHIVNKSETIITLHNLLLKKVQEVEEKNDKLNKMQEFSVREIMRSLGNLQTVRKSLLMFHHAKVPRSEWFLMSFLALILILGLSAIPSYLLFIPSFFKAIFGTCILLVLFLLYRLDNLKVFEDSIGERTARDILEIFSGKK